MPLAGLRHRPPPPYGPATGRIYMVPISQHLRAADVGTWARSRVSVGDGWMAGVQRSVGVKRRASLREV